MNKTVEILTEIVKHLPGQHDQADHAGNRGAAKGKRDVRAGAEGVPQEVTEHKPEGFRIGAKDHTEAEKMWAMGEDVKYDAPKSNEKAAAMIVDAMRTVRIHSKHPQSSLEIRTSRSVIRSLKVLGKVAMEWPKASLGDFARRVNEQMGIFEMATQAGADLKYNARHNE